MVEIICNNLDAEGIFSKNDTMLAWDQVRVMNKEGIQFGSHTVTHPILSKCEESRIRNEVLVSKRTIEHEIDKEVSAFAYPSGRNNDFYDRAIKILKMTGYKCAVSIKDGTNNEKTDRFRLKRNAPVGETVEHFSFGICLTRLMFKQD